MFLLLLLLLYFGQEDSGNSRHTASWGEKWPPDNCVIFGTEIDQVSTEDLQFWICHGGLLLQRLKRDT